MTSSISKYYSVSNETPCLSLQIFVGWAGQNITMFYQLVYILLPGTRWTRIDFSFCFCCNFAPHFPFPSWMWFSIQCILKSGCTSFYYRSEVWTMYYCVLSVTGWRPHRSWVYKLYAVVTLLQVTLLSLDVVWVSCVCVLWLAKLFVFTICCRRHEIVWSISIFIYFANYLNHSSLAFLLDSIAFIKGPRAIKICMCFYLVYIFSVSGILYSDFRYPCNWYMLSWAFSYILAAILR